MLLLFETPAGFALFKVKDGAQLDKVEDIAKLFETPEAANKTVTLKAFEKFENTAAALESAAALVDSKLSKSLRKFLKAQCQGETLAIADSKLGNIIKEKLGVSCVHSSAVMELMRGVRSQLGELISGLAGTEMAPMSLGLSHSLSRYKLKFSPDKVDTMIVQAIGLLDDLDKELNTYAMRVREWYGWHFPELSRVVVDNIQYARAVRLMGERTNAAELDFSGVLAEEVEVEVKEAALISMGTEVSEADMAHIGQLCDQVTALAEYRAQLWDYLKARMAAIAPNLTVLVGELVGARLIAHAGSLMNLAKQPASTVQILGAEKALFRALKTKHDTPKYGLIFHASLIGQAAPKHKGKISRVLAAKCALSIRYDALGEDSEATIGLEARAKVEARLRQLEGRALNRASGALKGSNQTEPYDRTRSKETPLLITEAKTYNPAADSTLGATPAAAPASKKKAKKVKQEAPVAMEEDEEESAPDSTAAEMGDEATPLKKKKQRAVEGAEGEAAVEAEETSGETVKKAKGKKAKEAEAEERARQEAVTVGAVAAVKVTEAQEGKGKKSKARYFEGEEAAAAATPAAAPEPAKKKRKKSVGDDEGAASTPVTEAASNGVASTQKKKKKAVAQ